MGSIHTSPRVFGSEGGFLAEKVPFYLVWRPFSDLLLSKKCNFSGFLRGEGGSINQKSEGGYPPFSPPVGDVWLTCPTQTETKSLASNSMHKMVVKRGNPKREELSSKRLCGRTIHPVTSGGRNEQTNNTRQTGQHKTNEPKKCRICNKICILWVNMQ